MRVLTRRTSSYRAGWWYRQCASATTIWQSSSISMRLYSMPIARISSTRPTSNHTKKFAWYTTPIWSVSAYLTRRVTSWYSIIGFQWSPFHTGLRFSRKEASPSLKSGVQRIRAFSSTARSRSASIPAASAVVSKRFARATLLGLAEISSSLNSCARSINFSGATISFTSPISFASCASIRRPVRSRSRARLSPICRVRKTETIAGKNPIFTSVYPNFASGTAMVKSQSVAMPQPPASACPFTAAISGRGKLQMRRNIRAMRRESSWFSCAVCCAMAASISRSIPAQNALPAPVTITTRTCDFSISSSAVCNSPIICAEIALRFSGRFSVMVARLSVRSSCNVEYMSKHLPASTWQRRVRELRANLVGHLQHPGQALRINPRIGAGFAQRRDHVFCCDIADEFVSGERAAAESRQRAVKSSAACFVRGENFRFGVFGPAVQMHADFNSGNAAACATKHFADHFRSRVAGGVRQRNRFHANVFQPLEGFFHDFRPPRFIIRISKRHRNVHHQIFVGEPCFLVQLLDKRARFAARHVGIRAPKIRRDRIRISQRSHARRSQRPLHPFFIHNNSDDFRRRDIRGKGSEKLLHDVFTVRHLLHMLRRNEANRVNVRESREHKLAKIFRLELGRNEILQPLPGISGAFDKFYWFHDSPLRADSSQPTADSKDRSLRICCDFCAKARKHSENLSDLL